MGEPLDLEETIERYLLERWRLGNMAAVVVDPFQMHRSITTLQKARLPIRELPQTVGNTTAFSQSLYDAIKGRNVRMYHAADLREQALNAVAVEAGRGSVGEGEGVEKDLTRSWRWRWRCMKRSRRRRRRERWPRRFCRPRRTVASTIRGARRIST